MEIKVATLARTFELARESTLNPFSPVDSFKCIAVREYASLIDSLRTHGAPKNQLEVLTFVFGRLCANRFEQGFPEQWFYSAWYRYTFVHHLLHGRAPETPLEVEDDRAAVFLTSEVRRELEREVMETLRGTSLAESLTQSSFRSS